MQATQELFREISGKDSFSIDDTVAIVKSAREEDWDSFYSLSSSFAAYYALKVGIRFLDESSYFDFCHEFALSLWENFRIRKYSKLTKPDKIIDFLISKVRRFSKGKWKHILSDAFLEFGTAYNDKQDLAFDMALKEVSGLSREEYKEEEEKEYGVKSIHQILKENCVYHEDSDIFHNLEMSVSLSIRSGKLIEYYIPHVEKIHLLYLLNCCKIEYGITTVF